MRQYFPAVVEKYDEEKKAFDKVERDNEIRLQRQEKEKETYRRASKWVPTPPQPEIVGTQVRSLLLPCNF